MKIANYLFLFLCLLCTTTMQAAIGTPDAPFKLNDGENALKLNGAAYTTVYATYTATDNGTVDINMLGDRFEITHNGAAVDVVYAASSFTAVIENVNKGDVFVFQHSFLMTDALITINMLKNGEKPQITPIDFTPKTGNLFSWNNGGDVTVQFNRSITISGAVLVIGTTEYAVSDIRVTNAFATCNIKTVLNELLNNGTIAPGKKFIVRFKGIADASDPTNLYANTGILNVDYYAPYPQTVLESQNFAEEGAELKSFYAPTDPNGVFTMTFSEELKEYDQTEVTLMFGDIDKSASGMYYTETVPYTISGKSINIDLRNKIRTLNSMLPHPDTDVELSEEIDIEHIYLRVTNVMDKNSNFVNSPGIGTTGSYTYQLTLQSIDMSQFTCEILPATTDSNPKKIDTGNEIEFWFSDPNLFTLGYPMGFDIYVGEELTDQIHYHKLIDTYDEVSEEHVYTEEVDETAPIRFQDIDGGKSIILTLPALKAQKGSTIKIVCVGINRADGNTGNYHATYVYGNASSGINALESEAASVWYSLTGQRTNNAKNGIIVTKAKKLKAL